ncbi:hypothetical protein PENSUB_13626 [Penicillium subrubescens]|uniref:Uncharacterized protein n=1 Tax=Penicillium subrubescens TaxID=1316194 RepID=A0A1Q5SNM0_9EURO|nr:hypothetical protein PENSUB_13626 [Penicillium subrubescens]
MKFSRALLSLPALSNVAFTAPFTNEELQATNQNPNPEEIVTEIREAFNLILELTGKVSAGAGLVDAGSAVLRNGRRSIPLVFEYDMEALRTNRSIKSHKKIANPLIGINANDGTPALAHHYRLNGVRGRESNRTRDYDIYHFEDGTAHLRVPSVGSSSSVTRRHDGAGVKIAFQHASVALAPSEYDGAASAIASRWQEYSEQGYANVFGFMEKNNQEVFYYRSIVEGQGFGDNYEDIMACGDISLYVGLLVVAAAKLRHFQHCVRKNLGPFK